MAHYRVKWEIDIEADTAQEAAQQALDIQRDAESTATVFHVDRWLDNNGLIVKSELVDLGSAD